MNLPNDAKVQAESIEKRMKRIKNERFQMVGIAIVLICMCIGSIQGKKKTVVLLNLCPPEVSQGELPDMDKNKLPLDENQPEVTITPGDQQIPDSKKLPKDTQEKPLLTLNALSACLMDASNGRVLYGK
ncbi:MAG: hypothetical protein PUC65_03555, partial [Clostridiales bacterium]|nr:hypothetical protein [Clostridiales bacterium]